jgi:hypothetical protein
LFRAWETRLAPEIKEAFHPLTRAVNNWLSEIMTYFDHQVTNAYTESLNNLIRFVDRQGRGYSFEALRAKVLYTNGVHKVKREKFRRQVPTEHQDQNVYFSMLSRMATSRTSTQIEEREINCGTDMSTLLRMCEEGLI